MKNDAQIQEKPAVKISSRRLADREEVTFRKLSFLKRSGLFGADTKGATIERACTLEDLREAYRLVHDVYLGTGFVKPEPSGVRLRLFETSSETATFVAKKNGKVVGVLSVVGDSTDLGLPSDIAFKSELDALRATGARLCEITNQAVAEEFRRSAIPTELMRCAIAHQMQAGYRLAVASVSPGHQGFYNILGFTAVGSQRSYSSKLHDPVIALCLEIDHYRRTAENLSPPEKFIHALATVSNPYLLKVSEWAREARNHFLNPVLLKQLFVAERDFLAECTGDELKILQRRWGIELYGAVKSSASFGPEISANLFSSLPSNPPFGNVRRALSSGPVSTVSLGCSVFPRVLRGPSSALPRRRLKSRFRLGSELQPR